jgi:hypothetical protein
MNPTYVEFELNQFLNKGQKVSNDFATVDICCDITNKITRELNLEYDKDFWFELAYYDTNGKRIIKFGFTDDYTAFLSKMMGIYNG